MAPTEKIGHKTVCVADLDPDPDPDLVGFASFSPISTLFLSRRFILVEIICANQSEIKFLCLPLKSCRNVSQGNRSFNFNQGKKSNTVALTFPLLKLIGWFPW